MDLVGALGWFGKFFAKRWSRSGAAHTLAKALLDEMNGIELITSGETEVQVRHFRSTVFDKRYHECVEAFPADLVSDLGRFYEDVKSAWTQRTEHRVGWSYLQQQLRDAPNRKAKLVAALEELSRRGRLKGLLH